MDYSRVTRVVAAGLTRSEPWRQEHYELGAVPVLEVDG